MTHQHQIAEAHRMPNNKHLVFCECGASAERDVLPWNGEVRWTGWNRADSWTSRAARRAADRESLESVPGF